MPEPAPAVWMPAVRCGTGADVFTERLAAALAERGIRCEVTWLPHRAEYAPWSVPVPSPPPWANIVHINSWLPPRFVPDKLPLVVTVHTWVHDPRLAPYKGLPRRLYHRAHILPNERHNIAHATRVAAVSRYVAAALASRFGASDIAVIHNGVDIKAFTPNHRRIRPRQPFRLLFVGKWTHAKGCDLLKPLMQRLGPGFQLVCVTDTRAPRAPLPNMHLTGPMGQKPLIDLYRQSDALIHPARLEGFGLAVCEAMACGLPVIASSVCALPEVVRHGETGILCPAGDTEAFAQAVRRLARDPDRWTSMARAAREHIQRHFSIPCMVDRYEALYREALS